jgi:hypothetical protein
LLYSVILNSCYSRAENLILQDSVPMITAKSNRPKG